LKIEFSSFENFKDILSKGTLLRFKKFKFPRSKKIKPRWVVILNNNPPSTIIDKVYFISLKHDWKKAKDKCSDPKILFNIIKDESLPERESAYDLSQIFTFEGKYLFSKYNDGEIEFKRSLNKESIESINNHIRKFLKTKYAKTLSSHAKKSIKPSN